MKFHPVRVSSLSQCTYYIHSRLTSKAGLMRTPWCSQPSRERAWTCPPEMPQGITHITQQSLRSDVPLVMTCTWGTGLVGELSKDLSKIQNNHLCATHCNWSIPTKRSFICSEWPIVNLAGSQRRSLLHDSCSDHIPSLKVKLLSRVRLFATPWTLAYHTPWSMGFSRQECWSGLPFPSPEDLPDPWIEPGSPAL